MTNTLRTEAIMAAWKLSNKEWDALDELRFTTTNAAVFRNATIILISAVERSKASIAYDLGLQHRDGRHRAQALSREWSGWFDSWQAARTHVAGHAGISCRLARRDRNTTARLGIRVQRLVAGSLERAFAQTNGHWFQRRPTGTDHEGRRLLVPASQAHHEGEARREGVRESRRDAALLKKKRSATTPSSC